METEPQVGLACVVKYKDDGKFYRCVITAIDDQMAQVLFVDYGNSQTNSLGDIRRLVPHFMRFPQLVSCFEVSM